MLRIVFFILLLAHGLIHLLGFIKEFKLAAVGQFTGKTLFPLPGGLAKTAGILWLLAALLFVAAAGAFFLKKDGWWMFAATGLALSQMLIAAYWPDAKFGTIANLIVLVVALPAFGAWKFEQKSRREIQEFTAKASTGHQTLDSGRLAALPPVVQKWLHRSGAAGKPIPQIIRLRQTGQMRTKPGGQWIPFEARQLFTTDPPGFYWQASINGGPGMTMTGRDRYADGRGELYIQLYSLFTVADTRGPETDQGALLRYLAEIIWFPPAATRPYIQWEQLDSLTAKATMIQGGITASGIYRFDANGDVAGFEADRYMTGLGGGAATLERWQLRTTAFREFQGLRIPSQGEATWKLKTGDFTWLTCEITALEYDSESR